MNCLGYYTKRYLIRALRALVKTHLRYSIIFLKTSDQFASYYNAGLLFVAHYWCVLRERNGNLGYNVKMQKEKGKRKKEKGKEVNKLKNKYS